MRRKDLSARFRRIGRRRDDLRAVGSHDLFAVRFLFGGNLYHEYGKIQSVERARHRKRSSPLSRSRFGRKRGQSLLFSVISLCRCGIELVRTRSVVTLEFIINFGGSAQRFFQAIRPDYRRRTVHLIKSYDLVGYIDISVGLIEFLFDYRRAENVFQILFRHGFQRGGIQHRRMFFLHVGAQVIPLAGHLVFGQIDLVGYRLLCHSVTSFRYFLFFYAKSPDAIQRRDDFHRVATQLRSESRTFILGYRHILTLLREFPFRTNDFSAFARTLRSPFTRSWLLRHTDPDISLAPVGELLLCFNGLRLYESILPLLRKICQRFF